MSLHKARHWSDLRVMQDTGVAHLGIQGLNCTHKTSSHRSSGRFETPGIDPGATRNATLCLPVSWLIKVCHQKWQVKEQHEDLQTSKVIVLLCVHVKQAAKTKGYRRCGSCSPG